MSFQAYLDNIEAKTGKTMQFVNMSSAREGDGLYQQQQKGNVYWAQRLVQGKFRYNWDVAKATPIAGMPITDSQFARFHLIGWAKEFTMTGSTGVHSGS